MVYIKMPPKRISPRGVKKFLNAVTGALKNHSDRANTKETNMRNLLNVVYADSDRAVYHYSMRRCSTLYNKCEILEMRMDSINRGVDKLQKSRMKTKKALDKLPSAERRVTRKIVHSQVRLYISKDVAQLVMSYYLPTYCYHSFFLKIT